MAPVRVTPYALWRRLTAMPSPTLLAASCLSVDKFASAAGLIEVHATSRQAQSACPTCGTPSRRVQSRYRRTLSDLPWHGD